MKLIDTLKDKAGSVLGATESLGKASLDTLEKATQLGLESCTYYNNLGIKQLRALFAVKDPATLRNYVVESVSLGGEVAKHVVEDCQKTIALGADMRSALSNQIEPSKPVTAPGKAATAKASAA